MSKVSVVIPVYGQWHLVKRSIDALIKFEQDEIHEILIVDDCSPEPNMYVFNNKLVRVIANERNLGYAGSVNTGLKEAVSDIIVLLDSDAYPVCPFVKRLVSMYAENDSIGCIGFSTVDENGNYLGNYQLESSIAGLVLGQALESKLKLSAFKRTRNILPHSCAVSFKKRCLEEMNYLDDRSFPVLDADVDLSMRIHRSSWKLIFTGEIIMCHKGGSSYKVNYKRVLLHHKSRWTLLKKFDLVPFPSLMKVLLKLRVRVELFVLGLFTILKADAARYKEKIQGRKILLKDIDGYK